MPHSTTPEDSSTAAQDQDAMVIDVENEYPELETAQFTVASTTSDANGNSQESNGADNDMTMADVGVEGDEVPVIKDEVKSEFKLEDLFADIDSDEEFPSSAVQDIKVAPSSPEEPVLSL